jgi:Pectate lyase superfamily protein
MHENNVKTFGAKGDGITDDTAAIQSTIDAAILAGGGVVLFPLGTYKTTGALQCSSSHIVFLGIGQGSIIRPIGDFDTIFFAAPGNTYIYGNRIVDILFDEAGKTGGRTIVGQYVAQFHAMRVYGGSGWNGWHFHNFNNVTLDHCRFESYRGNYYGRVTGGGAGVGKGRSDVLRLFGLVLGGERKPGMIGIDIDGFVHTVNGWGVHLINIGAQGLLARNTLGAEDDPTFFTFDDLECDYPDLECIRLDAGQRFFFNNAQLNGTRGAASNIYIGANVRGASFTGGFSSGAQQAGISIDGQDVTLSAMHFYFNSSPEFGGAKNAYPGILLGMASKDVTVTGCRSGQEATKDYQRSGCQVDTTADGFVIVGNDFRYNVMSGVHNGAGVGSSKCIANNI